MSNEHIKKLMADLDESEERVKNGFNTYKSRLIDVITQWMTTLREDNEIEPRSPEEIKEFLSKHKDFIEKTAVENMNELLSDETFIDDNHNEYVSENGLQLLVERVENDFFSESVWEMMQNNKEFGDYINFPD